MKPRTPKAKKYVLAGGTALFAALAEVSTTMAAGGLVNVPRTVIVGVAVGVVVRALGAVLAKIAQEELTDEAGE